MNGLDGDILQMALAATTIVKVLIDTLKMAWSPPQWAPPALALVGGIVVVMLLHVAAGHVMTGQAAAQSILAGLLAGGGAVGSTELQRRTLPGKG